MLRTNNIHYGWWIVSIGFIGMTLNLAVIIFFTLGIFMPYLMEENAWSRTQISGAITLSYIAGALFTPYIGRLIDLFGCRLLLLAVICILASSFSSLCFLSSSLIHYYFVFLLFGLVGSTPIICYTRAIVAWFGENRGMALGVAMSGTGFGAAIIPPLSTLLIESIGWRQTYFIIGIVCLVVTVPLIVFLFKESPLSSAPHLTVNKHPGHERIPAIDSSTGVTVKEAYSSMTFWVLVVSFFLAAFSLNGLIIHFVPLLVDAGYSNIQASLYFSIIGYAVIVGRISCGFLLDRFSPPYVAAVFFILSSVGISFILVGVDGYLVPFSALLIGFGVGAETDLMAFLVGRYFGLKNYGELYGYIFSSFIVGTSLGPLYQAYIFDSLGSYQVGIGTVVCTLLISSLLITKLKPMQKGTGLKTISY